MLERIHKLCTDNRTALSESKEAGCFYCEKIFDPRKKKIKEWAMTRTSKQADDALCPFCGIDSVLPGSRAKLSVRLLALMYKRWFGRTTG